MEESRQVRRSRPSGSRVSKPSVHRVSKPSAHRVNVPEEVIGDINPKAPGFLKLAGEIRNQIYTLVIAEYVDDPAKLGTTRRKFREGVAVGPATIYKYIPKPIQNLAFSCHQVRDEIFLSCCQILPFPATIRMEYGEIDKMTLSTLWSLEVDGNDESEGKKQGNKNDLQAGSIKRLHVHMRYYPTYPAPSFVIRERILLHVHAEYDLWEKQDPGKRCYISFSNPIMGTTEEKKSIEEQIKGTMNESIKKLVERKATSKAKEGEQGGPRDFTTEDWIYVLRKLAGDVVSSVEDCDEQYGLLSGLYERLKALDRQNKRALGWSGVSRPTRGLGR
ncbi:hypothetical protein P280DRAFT_215001 [Massarina eburnea CBS 473.64]|uniref:Uncharacterized protein n=1 Tax=Massarina eburnea CBS 473.64 TaxID=1395130 RepID=A0A6A6S7I1_9PLEO|nr:hypothetical protein P280DRAFT_215001 [Massarina eburnea CBS 473.64]